jgi:hypothetical protein
MKLWFDNESINNRRLKFRGKYFLIIWLLQDSIFWLLIIYFWFVVLIKKFKYIIICRSKKILLIIKYISINLN